MANANLTAQRLRELLRYNPDTGLFTRLMWRGGTSRAGSIAGGSHGKTGYTQIAVDGRLYFAHRLAWLYVHGEWPAHHIDHINGNGADNRIANLRDVPQTVNMQNQRRPKRGANSGTLGVTKRRDKFIAQITINGKHRYLGIYATAEQAGAAYLEAKRAHHAGCTI